MLQISASFSCLVSWHWDIVTSETNADCLSTHRCIMTLINCEELKIQSFNLLSRIRLRHIFRRWNQKRLRGFYLPPVKDPHLHPEEELAVIMFETQQIHSAWRLFHLFHFETIKIWLQDLIHEIRETPQHKSLECNHSASSRKIKTNNGENKKNRLERKLPFWRWPPVEKWSDPVIKIGQEET